MGLRTVRRRLSSWKLWGWVAILLVAAYLLGPRPVVRISEAGYGCPAHKERNGTSCIWIGPPRDPPPCLGAADFARCMEPTAPIQYPAERRFALYLSTIHVRIFDVDLANGRIEGFATSANAG